MFVLSFVLTSLFSLFYVTREGDRFLHRGSAQLFQHFYLYFCAGTNNLMKDCNLPLVQNLNQPPPPPPPAPFQVETGFVHFRSCMFILVHFVEFKFERDSMFPPNFSLRPILDCSQSPIYTGISETRKLELPPSLFVRASATKEVCLNCRGLTRPPSVV